MSANNDGSIVIDTELDNGGFDKGADKLLGAVKDLTQAIEILGDNMMRSFGEITPTLKAIAESTASVNQKMSGAATQTAEANERMAETEGHVAQEAQKAAAAVNETATSATRSAETSSRAASSYEAALARVQKQIDAQKAKLSEYYAQMEQIKQSTDETLKHAESEEQVTRVLEIEEIEVQKLNEKYAAQLKTLADLEAEYGRLSTAKTAAAQSAQQESFAPEPDAVNKWQVLGSALKSAASHALKLGTNLAKISFSALKKGISSVVSGLKKLTSQSNSAKIQANALVKSLLSVKNMLIARIKRTFISEIFNSAKESLQMLAVYSDSYNRAMSSMKNASAQLSTNVAIALGGLIEKVAPIITKILNGVSKMITYISAFFGLITGKNTMLVAKEQTDDYRQSIAGATQQTGSYGDSLNGASSAAQSYSSSLGSASSAAKSYSDSSKKAEKTTDSYGESAAEAAEEVKELNRQQYSFDELNKRSEKDVKDNIDALDDLSSYDPSDLDPYSGYNPTYPSYDPSNPGYDPYSGLDPAAVQQAQDMFEEVPIGSQLPDKLSSLFDELKKMWEDGDYFNFGKLLGEQFNKLIEGIDNWINNVFRPNGVKWAKNIAEILNGLVAGVDWKLLGKTIADGLNAIVDIVNTFFDTFDFETFGKSLGQMIRSWFDTVDWQELARMFANRWNALIDTIHGIVTTPGIWKSIGTAISTFVTNALLEIDFPKLGETLATGFEGIMYTLKTAAQKFQERSGEISTHLATGINNAVKGVDWANAAQSAGSFVLAVLDTLLETVKKTDWVAVGRAIGEFLGNIPWGQILADVFAIIWEVASGLIAGLFDTGSGKVIMAIGAGVLAIKGLFNAASIAMTVAQFVNAIGAAFPATLPAVTAFVSGIGSALAGIVPAATAMVSSLGTALAPIASVIFSPTGLIIMAIVAAVALIIANWDKIKEAATQLVDWLSQKWDALKEYTAAKWDALKTTVSQKAIEIKSSVVNTWNTLCMEASQKWDALTEYTTAKWDTLKMVISQKAAEIKSVVINTWNVLSTEAAQKWDELKEYTIAKWEAMRAIISQKASEIKGSVVDAWNALSTEAGQKWDALKDVVSEKFSTVKDSVSATAVNVKTSLGRAWDDTKRAAQTAWDSINSAIKTEFDKVKSPIQKTVTDVKNQLSRDWNTVKTDTQRSWQQIQTTISTPLQQLPRVVQTAGSQVVSAFQQIWGGVNSQAQNAWRTILNGMQSLWSQVQSGLSSLFSMVSSRLQSLWSQAQSGISSLWNNVTSTVGGLGRSAWNGMKQVGSYIGQGLQSGITGARRVVTGAIDYLTGGSISRAYSNYGIGSPSKVFAEIGKFLDLGLAQGIDNYESNVLSSISNMAENAVNEVDTNGATFKIGAESNDLVSKLSSVSDQLFDIVGAFKEINNALSSMGGFTAPAIATGTVAPYATKVSAVPVSSGIDPNTLAGSIDNSERMYDMVSLLRQILERLERTENIDNDELAAALAFALRGESRGFGAV